RRDDLHIASTRTAEQEPPARRRCPVPGNKTALEWPLHLYTARLHCPSPCARRSMHPTKERDRRFFTGISRAFGGAIFFSLPLLMTMEMWWLGIYMDRLRLAGFMVLMIPLLIGLDHFSGFEETSRWAEDVLDGF